MARPRSDIGPRILHAARTRFLHEGVDGASLRAIARAARTSIGMVYYYFPTKDALFLAVVEEAYEGLLRDVALAFAPTETVEARLHRVARRIATMTEDELDVVRLVVREALVSSERRSALLARFSRGHLPLVLQTVLEGRTSGAIDPDQHPMVEALAMVGVLFAPQILRRLAGSQLPGGDAIPAGEELADMLADALLRGIGGRIARAPAAE